MPTVPMFIQHPRPTDASHGVFAPGGYEWWHFDAEDEDGGVIVTIDFIKGCSTHREYAKRYRRYRRRPTRFAPPLPDEYPCVSVTLFDQHALVAGFHRALGPGELAASRDALNLTTTVGRVRDDRPGSGIRVSANDPISLVRIDLLFRPVLSPQVWGSELCEGAIIGSTGWVRDRSSAGSHYWMLSDPLCRVEGEVILGSEQRTVKIEGLGYHDYSYGTGPMGGDVRARVLGEDGFVAYRARGGLVEGSEAGIVQHRSAESPSKLSFMGIEMGPMVKICAPDVLEASPHGDYMICRASRADSSRRAFGELMSRDFGGITAP